MSEAKNESALSDQLGPLPPANEPWCFPYTSADMRAYARQEVHRAVAAERERSVQLWRHYAYAALGMHRDQMTPEDVAAVQRFLGPLEA